MNAYKWSSITNKKAILISSLWFDCIVALCCIIYSAIRHPDNYRLLLLHLLLLSFLIPCSKILIQDIIKQQQWWSFMINSMVTTTMRTRSTRTYILHTKYTHNMPTYMLHIFITWSLCRKNMTPNLSWIFRTNAFTTF